jgi:adenylate cyclase
MNRLGLRMSPYEIERKFLVREIPKTIETYPCVEISQGYLAVTADGTEIRLRNRDRAYVLTVKSGKGMKRHERETELSREQFETLWTMTEGRRVEKMRYKIPMDGFIIELDIYRGALEDLMTAEVEFPTQNDADSFSPPSWFDKEVTQDESFKNQSLALNGLPEEFQLD